VEVAKVQDRKNFRKSRPRGKKQPEKPFKQPVESAGKGKKNQEWVGVKRNQIRRRDGTLVTTTRKFGKKETGTSKKEREKLKRKGGVPQEGKTQGVGYPPCPTIL